MEIALTQEDNLIFQSYWTVCLILELKKNDFTNSDFFRSMNFGDASVREIIQTLGVDN